MSNPDQSGSNLWIRGPGIQFSKINLSTQFMRTFFAGKLESRNSGRRLSRKLRETVFSVLGCQLGSHVDAPRLQGGGLAVAGDCWNTKFIETSIAVCD
jgi:hypothetical protein